MHGHRARAFNWHLDARILLSRVKLKVTGKTKIEQSGLSHLVIQLHVIPSYSLSSCLLGLSS